MARAFYHRHTASVIARILKYAALAVALAALAVLVAVMWLLETPSGSRWLWNRSTSLIPGEMRADAIEGSIGDGLTLIGLSYSSEAVDIDVAEARISANIVLAPMAVNLRELQAAGVRIRQKETEPPDEPEESILDKLKLPLRIDVQQVVVRDLQLFNNAGERIFAANDATLAGSWHEHISLTRVDVDSDIGGLSGTVRLGLDEPYPASAAVDITYPLRVAEDSVHPLVIAANAEGSLADLEIEVTNAEPALRIAGSLFDLVGEPGWDLRVQSPYIQWPFSTDSGQSPTVYLRQADFTSSGQLAAYRVSGEGTVSVAGTEELRFTLDTDGNADGLAVNVLQLQGGMLEASSNGEIRWAGGFAIAADAEIARFDVSDLVSEWPANRPVSGTVDAGWSAGRVALNEVRLRVQNEPAALDAAGRVDIDAGVVDLDLDWRDLQWPMNGAGDRDALPLVSEFGRVNVSGSPDAWAFNGRIAFRPADFPQGVFVLSGSGNREEVEAVLHESEILGGSAAGRGSYSWSKDGVKDGAWSAELVTENLNIGPLAPDFPGRISSDFSAEGRLNPVRLSVDIRKLDGVIRDKRIEGAGGLRYVDGNLHAQQLRIASGESYLEANGNLESDSGLDFSLDIAAIESFYPAVAGSLRGGGNVSLGAGFPAARIDLQARDLAWKDWSLEHLTLTSDEAQTDFPLSLTATGDLLKKGVREVESFSARVAASDVRQRLQFDVSRGDEQIGVELDGRLEDWKRPMESVWTGQLRRAGFRSHDGVSFTLDQPADMRLSTELVALDRACLAGTEHSRICLDANWTGGANFDITAQMAAVPLNLLRLFYETDLEFTQALDGSLTLGTDADNALSGDGRIDISPGRIENPNDRRVATQTGAGEVHFRLASGQLLSGRLRLPFAGTAEIDGRFAVADIGLGSDSAIDGQLLVNLNDIAVVANVVPAIDDARGRLDVDMKIAGTLGNPLFVGEAAVKAGAFHYAPLGLRLTDIDLQTVIQEDNRIDLQSTFRAGEGTGELQSSTVSFDGLRSGLELSLSGENLTVIDLPDINVVANMDLGVGIRKNSLRLNGNVLIPRARISPVDLTSGKVSESEDVVIVSDRDSEVMEEEPAESPFEFTGTVALVLGKDVLVDLDVAEARLTGTSAFHWSGPPVPTANGQYNIEGRFQAYGQLLEITEGSIQFPGIPATNPNLRVRAEREIFGNPQIRSAGVLVTGTAREPVVEVYTNPATTQDRALTLLVTGSDFNYEQGVGAVDVGTYVAPKLYISYGIGLFDRGNVISVRYDIAKGFGIKATSGANAEGVDLSYTIQH